MVISQLPNKEEETATKMFITVLLIISLSLLTQSAPAADPAPCVQIIDIPIMACRPVLIGNDPTTGHFEEECVTEITQEWLPCDF